MFGEAYRHAVDQACKDSLACNMHVYTIIFLIIFNYRLLVNWGLRGKSSLCSRLSVDYLSVQLGLCNDPRRTQNKNIEISVNVYVYDTVELYTYRLGVEIG